MSTAATLPPPTQCFPLRSPLPSDSLPFATLYKSRSKSPAPSVRRARGQSTPNPIADAATPPLVWLSLLPSCFDRVVLGPVRWLMWWGGWADSTCRWTPHLYSDGASVVGGQLSFFSLCRRCATLGSSTGEGTWRRIWDGSFKFVKSSGH